MWIHKISKVEPHYSQYCLKLRTLWLAELVDLSEQKFLLPFLETVAGEALSMLWGSKMILQFGAMGIRSPLASVRVLLSSRTELRFSIQIASTGPSNTSHMCSPVNEYTWILMDPFSEAVLYCSDQQRHLAISYQTFWAWSLLDR